MIAMGGGGLHPNGEFKQEVAVNRARIHNLNRLTINPRSKFMRVWDVITIIALIFTTFVTPFEVGFLNMGFTAYAGPANFTFNRLVDAVFALDVVLTFFMPYRTPHAEGGMLVFGSWRIIRHYLRGCKRHGPPCHSSPALPRALPPSLLARFFPS